MLYWLLNVNLHQGTSVTSYLSSYVAHRSGFRSVIGGFCFSLFCWVDPANCTNHSKESRLINHNQPLCYLRWHATNWLHHLMKTSSKWLECCNLHPKWLHPEATSTFYYWINVGWHFLPKKKFCSIRSLSKQTLFCASLLVLAARDGAWKNGNYTVDSAVYVNNFPDNKCKLLLCWKYSYGLPFILVLWSHLWLLTTQWYSRNIFSILNSLTGFHCKAGCLVSRPVLLLKKDNTKTGS